MCGIFAYLGNQDAIDVCLEGLKKLEYRGYDSSGIAGVESGKLFICKAVGKIEKMEALLQFEKPCLSFAIAHTRWATHGAPSQENAHPHTDQNQRIAVVHNGVIENYAEMKDKLIHSDGVIFSSETDTEVVPHLFAKFYTGDLLAAAVKVFALLEGSFALAVMHTDHPDALVATAEKSPLVIAFDPDSKESFISSDPNALAGKKVQLFYLADREIAYLKKGQEPLFFDKKGKKITKGSEENCLACSTISKGIYEHYMLKEIFEQERVAADVIAGRYDSHNKTAYFEELQGIDLSSYQHVMIIACGSSFHAAAIAAYFFEEMAHLETKIEIASEYRYKTPIFSAHTLIVVLSQSGETADTIAAMRRLKKIGMKVIALCNVASSTIAREADATLFLRSGPEVAVASTKTFVAQLCVLYLLTILLARQRGMTKERAEDLFVQISKIPSVIAEVLDEHRTIQKLAIKYAKYHDWYFLGRGVLYPTALEAALKLKEIAYVNAVGYPAGEMKHGPIALLDSHVPVVVFCANHLLEKKVISNLMESRARSAPIIVFGWNEFLDDFHPFCEDQFIIPMCSDELACIPLTVVSQLFAYFIAKERKLDIDKPRNLAKSVTVE